LQKNIAKTTNEFKDFLFVFPVGWRKSFFSNFQTPFPRISKIKPKTAEEVEIGTNFFTVLDLL
jgi:hypothetical protein